MKLRQAMRGTEDKPGLANAPFQDARYQAQQEPSRTAVLCALRRTLDDLPLEERQLVALHFAGGLSHEEISQAMAVKRSEVEHQLAEAQKLIRRKLADEGIEMAQQISAGSLTDAICSGYPVPPGLFERVMRKVEQHCATDGSLDAGKQWGGGRVTLFRAGISLLIVTAAAFLLWAICGQSNG